MSVKFSNSKCNNNHIMSVQLYLNSRTQTRGSEEQLSKKENEYSFKILSSITILTKKKHSVTISDTEKLSKEYAWIDR